MPLPRDAVTLVVLALADGGDFTPVQIQKALFLASEEVPDAFELLSRFNFQPYDYGPFDSAVYSEIERLEQNGLAEIAYAPNGRWRLYRATEEGIERAQNLYAALTAQQVELLKRIVRLVRTLSFNELVSAIYRSYPRMRERSVFREE